MQLIVDFTEAVVPATFVSEVVLQVVGADDPFQRIFIGELFFGLDDPL